MTHSTYEAGVTVLTPLYLERDAHGDVTWTTDETGAPTGHASYDPFGNMVSVSGSIPSDRWQSSYQDDSHRPVLRGGPLV